MGMQAATQQKKRQGNIRKAQEVWQRMSPRARAIAQPEGRNREKPGTQGGGAFYRIVVRPKEEFVTFRTQDVGKKGHIERLSGKRGSGSWDTQAWLIHKDDAHLEDHHLVPDTVDAKAVLKSLASEPKYFKGDIFKAKDRPNIPEAEKPTMSQRKARKTNIKKAQHAWREKHQ